jgi:hypothetical protein
MPAVLDTVLVVLAVVLAIVYLVSRKVRTLKKVSRDWSSGHAEACDHCPAVKIRQAQSRLPHPSK